MSRIVQNLMENRSGGLGSEVDEYAYFDPKVGNSSSAGEAGGNNGVPRTKSAFNEAIVFVVGGGSYIEYQNLVDLYNNNVSIDYFRTVSTGFPNLQYLQSSKQTNNLNNFLLCH